MMSNENEQGSGKGPGSSRPHVSIVICTYARAALLGRTLMALKGVAGIGQAEVIVVDNNSPDSTAITVLDCIYRLKDLVAVKYLFEPRQGLSVARNRGVAAARGDIVAFLDDDAIPAVGWLNGIVRAFARHPDAGAVGGPIEPEFETPRPAWLVEGLEMPYTIVDLGRRERQYPRRLAPFGANMAIRREVFDKLRFPEELGRKGQSLLSGEESWLFDKVRRKRKLVYVPGMKVRHFIPAERLNEQWIKRRYYYQGVSAAMGGLSALSMIRIVSLIVAKRIRVALGGSAGRSPGQRLIRECRLESIRGAMDTLRNRGAVPLYD